MEGAYSFRCVIIEYQLEYRKNDEDFKRRIVHAEDLPYKLTGLIAYTRYGFRVAAINLAGTRPFTDVTQFTSKCCKTFLL